MKHSNATFAHNLLEEACKKTASDIHFYPIIDKEDIHIYFRLAGQRTFIKKIKKNVYQMLLTYFKFSSNMDIAEIKKPQNGTLSFISKDKNDYSLRLSTLPNANTESLTIRILPQADTPFLEQLCIFPSQFKTMKSWLKHRAGIILMTGPTGSGKTTTMYALLESLLQETSYQAITLEDPVERKLDDVIQVEVNEKAGITYQTGLKAALRHDPDILMIGEIRDAETAAFAFRAALTGHLVLSTLHAKDAAGTIDRLLDIGIKKTDISQTLIAVAAIQLLPLQNQVTQGKRAAILELLEGEHLQQVIDGGKKDFTSTYHTFEQLREKAYLYGFISKKIYEDTF